MLSMVGTIQPRTVNPGLTGLSRQLTAYRTVRVSNTEAVFLIPTVGAVLIDSRPSRMQFELAGRTSDILQSRIMSLTDELSLDEGDEYILNWKPATKIPLPFR